MGAIKVALIGIGNCASSLVQGKYYYSAESNDAAGLIHREIGGYLVSDIEFVAAFDTDARKVGKPLNEAIFAAPNCTAVFADKLPEPGVTVKMGARLDGMAEHAIANGDGRGFKPADLPDATAQEVIATLKESGAEVLVNFLPVGSQEATEFYIECALEAGLGVVNCIPVFIASDDKWANRFRDRGLPIVGDDVKAQLGATILHRTLAELFGLRGVTVDHSYQLNTGGNTDFLNMLDRGRLASKKVSKTEAVQSNLVERLSDNDIHVGPSDYIPWLKDNKLCFLRMEGSLFGNVPMNVEIRLSVEDSPNSAAVVADAIRCCKLGLERGISGPLEGPSAFFCKHPPIQHSDVLASTMVDDFIAQGA